jgi:hypothetical protein
MGPGAWKPSFTLSSRELHLHVLKAARNHPLQWRGTWFEFWTQREELTGYAVRLKAGQVVDLKRLPDETQKAQRLGQTMSETRIGCAATCGSSRSAPDVVRCLAGGPDADPAGHYLIQDRGGRAIDHHR